MDGYRYKQEEIKQRKQKKQEIDTTIYCMKILILHSWNNAAPDWKTDIDNKERKKSKVNTDILVQTEWK